MNPLSRGRGLSFHTLPAPVDSNVRAVIQRDAKARVSVAGEIVGRIGPGLCILLGVAITDTASDAERLAEKICQLRIFEDEQGKMNHSSTEIGAQLLVISQFTLYGNCRKETAALLLMQLRRHKGKNSTKGSLIGYASRVLVSTLEHSERPCKSHC